MPLPHVIFVSLLLVSFFTSLVEGECPFYFPVVLGRVQFLFLVFDTLDSCGIISWTEGLKELKMFCVSVDVST